MNLLAFHAEKIGQPRKGSGHAVCLRLKPQRLEPAVGRGTHAALLENFALKPIGCPAIRGQGRVGVVHISGQHGQFLALGIAQHGVHAEPITLRNSEQGRNRPAATDMIDGHPTQACDGHHRNIRAVEHLAVEDICHGVIGHSAPPHKAATRCTISSSGPGIQSPSKSTPAVSNPGAATERKVSRFCSVSLGMRGALP